MQASEITITNKLFCRVCPRWNWGEIIGGTKGTWNDSSDKYQGMKIESQVYNAANAVLAEESSRIEGLFWERFVSGCYHVVPKSLRRTQIASEPYCRHTGLNLSW